MEINDILAFKAKLIEGFKAEVAPYLFESSMLRGSLDNTRPLKIAVFADVFIGKAECRELDEVFDSGLTHIRGFTEDGLLLESLLTQPYESICVEDLAKLAPLIEELKTNHYRPGPAPRQHASFTP